MSWVAIPSMAFSVLILSYSGESIMYTVVNYELWTMNYYMLLHNVFPAALLSIVLAHAAHCSFGHVCCLCIVIQLCSRALLTN